MARRKQQETVSIDEVRDEITGALEGESAEDTGQEVEVAPIAGPDDVTQIVQDEMILYVPMTKDELIEQGQILIEAMDDSARARQTLKAAQAQAKAEEEEAHERADAAKSLLRAKKVERRVEVEQIHNWTRRMVYTRRMDTGEIVKEREMTRYELQMPIPEEAPSVEGEDLSENETDGELAGVTAGEEAGEG